MKEYLEPAIAGSLCWRLPIFPDRRQSSIVGTSELNFRVRNGNGWTLTAKNTNCLQAYTLKTEQRFYARLKPAFDVGQALGLLVPVG